MPKPDGYNLHAIPKDGNCMFNAVISALNSVDPLYLQNIIEIDSPKNRQASQKLRNKVVEFIQNKIATDPDYKVAVIQNARFTLEIFFTIDQLENMSDEEILDEYYIYLQANQEWGDHVALNAMSDIFAIQIHVYNDDHPVLTIGDQYSDEIHLHLEGEMHYSVFLPEQDEEDHISQSENDQEQQHSNESEQDVDPFLQYKAPSSYNGEDVNSNDHGNQNTSTAHQGLLGFSTDFMNNALNS